MKKLIINIIVAAVVLMAAKALGKTAYYSTAQLIAVAAFGLMTAFWLNRERHSIGPAGASIDRKSWKWTARIVSYFFIAPQLASGGDFRLIAADGLFIIATFAEEMKFLGRGPAGKSIFAILWLIIVGSYVLAQNAPMSFLIAGTTFCGVATLGTLSGQWRGSERLVVAAFATRFVLAAFAAYGMELGMYAVVEGLFAAAIITIMLLGAKPSTPAPVPATP